MMRKKCNWSIGIILSICLSLIFSSPVLADSTFFLSQIPTIPNGSIIIDGTPSGWNGIPPVVADSPTDSICGPGTDIKDFYLAKDADNDNGYLYWRVDTADGTFSFDGSPYPKQLILLFYEPSNLANGPYPNGVSVNIVDQHSSLLVRRNNRDWTLPEDYEDYKVSVGAVAEGRIPLRAFSEFNINDINAYYWRAPDVIPQCDNAARSFTPPTPPPPPPPPPPLTNAVKSSVANLQGGAVSGARIEQVENPEIFTTSASNGSFTLGGLPPDTPFSLKITKDGYVTEYSSAWTLNPNPLLLAPYHLATSADMAGWNLEPGKTVIIGQVRDNGSPRQPIPGAVVTCISSQHQDVCPYPIIYETPGATGPYGKYRINNVDPGDIVTVSASKPGIDFPSRAFTIHDDGMSFGNINQRTSPSDPTLTINTSGTGSGFISTDIGTIHWAGTTGTANFNAGTVVTLTAEPDPGSAFSAWSGGCNIVDGNRCIVMKTGATTVTATFERSNSAPVFTAIAPIQANAGTLVQFSVEATDPDGDSITYYTEPLPSGASFDPARRFFSWIPDYNQTGTFTIRFFAQDNGTPQNKIGDTYVIISVSVPPPDVLIDQVVDTVYAFQLSKTVENSYLANLKKVKTFIQDAKLIPAINQLNATIKKVNTDMAQGKIDEAQGNKLILMITLLVNEIS